MKILAIIGSVRKGNTYTLVKQVEEKMRVLCGNDLEFEFLFLKDFHLEQCRGCMACQDMGEDQCPSFSIN